MQEHRLNIQGHQLVAYEYNPEMDTIPLIFIHGITGNIGFWEGVQIPLIKERFHWFSLSLAGHYPAQFPEHFSRQDMTAENLAEIMAQAVSELTKDKSAILLGHSTGGFVALAIAYQKPELVQSIILIDGFAIGKWHGSFRPAQLIAQLGEFPFWLYFKAALSNFQSFRASYLLIARDFGAAWASARFQKSARDSYPFSRNMDIRGMRHYFNRMPKIDIRAWLPKIQQEVKLLHGTRDWIIQPSHAEEMQKLLPKSELIWIKDSGHLPMFEREVAYETALSTALEGLLGSQF